MNYGELKHNLISLGFAEEADLEEYEDLGYLYDAVNRAIDDICVFFPYVAKYEFDIDENETDMLYIDMSAQKGFLRLGETPVLYERDGTEYFKKFSDYDTEMENTIVINPFGNEGSYRIYYEKQCTPIDKDTPDTFELEFPLVAHSLVPLLAAYYLWLDDEEQKATMYNNLYEQKLNQLLSKKKLPKATVQPDSEWGVI